MRWDSEAKSRAPKPARASKTAMGKPWSAFRKAATPPAPRKMLAFRNRYLELAKGFEPLTL
jgi:hypothetical protein